MALVVMEGATIVAHVDRFGMVTAVEFGREEDVRDGIAGRCYPLDVKEGSYYITDIGPACRVALVGKPGLYVTGDCSSGPSCSNTRDGEGLWLYQRKDAGYVIHKCAACGLVGSFPNPQEAATVRELRGMHTAAFMKEARLCEG